MTKTRATLPRGSLKYLLFIGILVAWIAAPLLSFSFPILSDRLVWVWLACVAALFLLVPGALFRLKWKEVATLSAILAIALSPFYGIHLPFGWLRQAAFRFHASPIEEYLAQCKLIEFDENGVKQNVGVCDRLPSVGDALVTIIYDTTGELALPVPRRTREWKKAMFGFSPGRFFTETEGHARHLFGNFYEVYVPLEEQDGSDDRD